jgi:hypothetical protein
VVVNGAVGLPNEHQLWAGDGNSTLKAFTLNNSVPPTATPTLGNPPGINTGGQRRVDEGAFDPAHNVLLFANNADTPPFGTLVNAATGAILGKITFDGTNGAPNATVSSNPYGIKTPSSSTSISTRILLGALDPAVSRR